MRQPRAAAKWHPGRAKFGWENMKSPRKTEILQPVSALLAVVVLMAGPTITVAQDPPTAPVPKVSPPPISQSPAVAGSQQTTPPPVQALSDSQTTLRVNVNLVILPVTV